MQKKMQEVGMIGRSASKVHSWFELQMWVYLRPYLTLCHKQGIPKYL